MKVIRITADKQISEHDIKMDTVAQLRGLIDCRFVEVMRLQNGEAWFDEEFSYREKPEPNWLASDVCGAMGRADVLFRPLQGTVVFAGPLVGGSSIDVTPEMRRVIDLVVEEGGGTWTTG